MPICKSETAETVKHPHELNNLKEKKTGQKLTKTKQVVVLEFSFTMKYIIVSGINMIISTVCVIYLYCISIVFV